MFLLQSNLYLLLFYGFYWLLFRRETFHQLNRIFLLASVIIAFLIPVWQSAWVQNLFFTEKVREVVVAVNLQEFSVLPVPKSEKPGFQWVGILFWLYVTGVLASACIFAYKLLKIRALIRNNLFQENQSAFSFFGFRFVPENTSGREVIAFHEQVHVRQLHSADVIFIEIVQIFNWFNPVVYALKQSLKNIHEYIADAKAVQQIPASDYATLLFSQTFQIPSNSLSHSFFDSLTLKKRIFMLQKTKSNRVALLKYGFILPVFAGMLMISAAFIQNSDKIEPFTFTLQASVLPKDSMQVSGKVFEGKQGKPLSGVKVGVKNTNIGTTTNTEGYFSIKCPANSELMFSFTGFKTKLLALNSNPQQSLFLQLEEEFIENRNGKIDSAKSLQQKKPSDSKKSQIVFSVAEEMPTYPGGLVELKKFLAENIQYPPAAQKANIQGNVYASFVVEEDGSVTDISTLKGLGFGCDEETSRVISLMPKWSPGKQNGKPISVKYVLPVSFSLGNPQPIDSIGKNTLFLLEGKFYDKKEFQKIDVNKIKSFEVLHPEKALELYGEKGKNKIIEIILKKD